MTDRLLTETGDNLTTESGDYLRTEQSTVTFEIECTGSAGVVSAKSVSGTAEVSSISGMVGAVGVKTGTGTVGITGISEMAPVSVTLANMRLSLADGVAFIDASQAGTLTPYIGSKVVVRDSAGKKAVGYIKAVGTGETYGDESITGWNNGGLPSWSYDTLTSAGRDITSAIETGTKGLCYAGLIAPYVDKGLYCFTASFAINGGQSPAILRNTISDVLATAVNGVNEIYAVWYMAALQDFQPSLKNTAATNFSLSNSSLKQVLTPSVTGVTIVSTQGGSTQSWASIENGFNYNDESGYSIIVGEFAITGQKDAVSTCHIDGTADSAIVQSKGGESSLSCDAIASVEATVSKYQSTTIDIESVGSVGVKPAIKINFELSSEGVISLHGYAASNETRYAKRSGRKSTYRRNSMRRAA